MSKIKFKLYREGMTLNFQILEMDERFRGNNGRIDSEKKDEKFFYAENGMRIGGVGCPEFCGNTLYLRGNVTKKDRIVCSTTFTSIANAMVYEAKILEALKDWSENWEGWDLPVKGTPKPEEEENVFIF